MEKLVFLALSLLTLGVVLFPQAGSACTIPVFRYALECWEADPYTAIVFYKEPLTAAEKNAIAGANRSPVNLDIRLADLNGELPAELKKLWEREQPQAVLPWMVIRYPGVFWEILQCDTLWAGTFDEKALAMVVDSPARAQVAAAILHGVSVVWIFIESGNKPEDDAKIQVLEDCLAWVTQEAELMKEDGEGVMVEKIVFRVIRLSRDDPREAMFIRMLLLTDPDHEAYKDQPITFPIFGQGRAIWPLIGEGINTNIIKATCAFMLGFCSCEVKDMNPGTDMLIQADWYSMLTDSFSVPDPVPTLVGVTAGEESGDRPTPVTLKHAGMPRLYKVILFSFMGFLLIVAVVSAVLIRNRRE